MATNVSKTTTDHETIRRWAEERGGWPAEVAATASEDRAGILRIDFPGYSGEGSLRRIGWDEWFQKFDDAGLAFVHEETTADGQRSNFNKLVSRETSAARARGTGTSRRSSGTTGSSRSSRAARSSGSARSTGARRGASAGGRSTRGGGKRQATRGEAAKTAGSRRTGTRSGGRKAGKTSRAARPGRRSGATRRGGRSTRRSR